MWGDAANGNYAQLQRNAMTQQQQQDLFLQQQLAADGRRSSIVESRTEFRRNSILENASMRTQRTGRRNSIIERAPGMASFTVILCVYEVYMDALDLPSYPAVSVRESD